MAASTARRRGRRSARGSPSEALRGAGEKGNRRRAMRLFLLTIMNGLTLAALYFLVASGFTLVFGLMRNVNLAHGSLYLLGAYVGYDVADLTHSWFLGVAAGFLSMAAVGVLLQVGIFRRMEGQDLRQTLVTIGLSIVLADLMLAIWGGKTYQFDPPDWLY